MRENLTVGLYGISGVYNYGCEAIVRGTEIILHDLWPDIHIKYASLRPQDDKKRLKGCKVEIVPREKYSYFSIPGVEKIFAHTTGIPFYPRYDEKIDWIDNCDAIFSIGGDLYTLPPNYKDRSILYLLNYFTNSGKNLINYRKKIFGNAYNSLIHFGDIVKKNDKKLIIWGASIGPFEKSDNAKNLFKNHLSTVDLITSREPVTLNYLKMLDIEKNVIPCADPAFAVSLNKKKEFNHDHPIIGINLSPLSTNKIFDEENKEKILLKQAKIIEELITNFEAEIILIPHVVSENINDDDLRFLKYIKTLIDDNFVDHVKIIDNDPGFIGTKYTISKCDIIIAARMHCAINALETGIPTIFLGYSTKSEGMAYYVYGNRNWVLPLKKFDSANVIPLIKKLFLEKENIKLFLEKEIKRIKKDAFNPLNSLNNML